MQIQVINDGITESLESLIITMQPVTTSCYVYPPKQVSLWIRDKNPVTALAGVLAASQDTIFCPGDQVTIEASYSGGEGFNSGWWGDDPNAPLIRNLQPNQTTTYYFYATDECMSDTAVDSVTIYLADYEPMDYITEDFLVCRGESVTFAPNVSNGRPPYLFRWPDNSTGNTYTVIPTADTMYYTFTITDQCGVQVIDSSLARVAPDPIAAFTYLNDYLIPLRVKFTNRSMNAATYAWDFGDGQTSTDENPTVDYARPGTYRVTLRIVSPDGCEHQVSLDVTVETDFYLYVPTAFTPDGDGLNECFEIKGVGFESFELKIFDRWGNQVFYSNRIEDCWDGTFGGQDVMAGAYTYTIFLRLPFDKIHERRGTLVLYR
jgi:gliding motility-associated-like protein